MSKRNLTKLDKGTDKLSKAIEELEDMYKRRQRDFTYLIVVELILIIIVFITFVLMTI